MARHGNQGKESQTLLKNNRVREDKAKRAEKAVNDAVYRGGNSPDSAQQRAIDSARSNQDAVRKANAIQLKADNVIQARRDAESEAHRIADARKTAEDKEQSRVALIAEKQKISELESRAGVSGYWNRLETAKERGLNKKPIENELNFMVSQAEKGLPTSQKAWSDQRAYDQAQSSASRRTARGLGGGTKVNESASSSAQRVASLGSGTIKISSTDKTIQESNVIQQNKFVENTNAKSGIQVLEQKQKESKSTIDNNFVQNQNLSNIGYSPSGDPIIGAVQPKYTVTTKL